MKATRALTLGIGGSLTAGAAIVAGRRWREAKAAQERALLEAELLAAFDEVEAEMARLNALFAEDGQSK